MRDKVLKTESEYIPSKLSDRKVVGSIPNEVYTFSDFHNPSSCTMALRPTEPLTEMSTKIFLGSKGWSVGKADSLTTF
jgi:hypothetical protein